MNAKERMIALNNGKPTDRIPFAPAIYEHKAFLVGTGVVPFDTPSEYLLYAKEIVVNWNREFIAA